MKKILVVALALTMLLTCLVGFTATATEALIANGSFDGGSTEGWVYGLRVGNVPETSAPT